MIFGSKQNREFSDRITGVMQQMIALAHTRHGLPAGFWQDPYVIGYILGQINGWLSAFGGDGLSIADKGRVVVEVFGALSGQKGKPLSEIAMVFAQQEQPDFLRGNQNGMFMAMFGAEKVPDADGIPAVAAARQSVAASGADPTHDAVTEHLARTLWVQEIRTRMSVGA